ncbi:hypothetical protein TNIN_171761 [Trichonephila inaurata madagascariensis]|uniref:Secreted protein n=1 Tax=Trichonephila inaurata madagascariensis TaxID=2747483 RepID=A0A8X6XJI0_9ARAC|nr:hypothetical protein TNIN_171761 [Trichonephila inaurata madagascariensis]
MWLYLIGFLCIMRGFLTSETQPNDARHNPKLHICVSKILECDSYRIRLSPSKEIGAPMFTKLNDLRKACKYVNRFLLCLKIASEYCKKFPSLLGNEMILSRSFPQELCQYNSFWEKLSLIEEKTEAISSPAVPSITTDSSENTNKPSEKANNRREGSHSRENAKKDTYPKERVFETFSNDIDELSLDFANKNNNLLKAEKILDVNANFKTDTSSNVADIPNEAEMEYFSQPNGDSFENEA